MTKQQLSVADVQELITSLQYKRDVCVKRGTELADERASLAFAAHTGDAKAAKRLADIHVAVATHASELTSIDDALKVAADKLEAAKRVEAEAVARENAVKVREGFAELAACATKIDEALAAFIAGSNEFVDIVRSRIHGAGSAFPTDTQAAVNAGLAVSTALMRSPWRLEFRHLSPGEKRTFVEVVQRWFEPTDARIKQRFGTEEAA